MAVSVASAAEPAPDTSPNGLWEAIRSASLDPARAVHVENLEIDMDQATLHLIRGVLVPAQSIGGRTLEMVFIGDGRFRMRPPDKIEQAQLELFTRRSELDVAVDRAMVALGDQAAADNLLGRNPVGILDEALARQATDLFKTWVSGAERGGFGADTAMLQTLLGDSLYQQFFVVWCRSGEVGDFYYRLDLSETEQIMLGQFVPLEVDDLEAHRMRKEIQRAQREGWSREMRFEHLGDWDTWIAAALRDKNDKPVTGSVGFESESYVLDVTLDPQQESLEGRARVVIRHGISGRRVVPLSLSRHLEVRAVENDSGQPMAWIRSRRDLYVVLDRPSKAGEFTTLSVRWGGKAFHEIQKGIFALSDTHHWYPRVGDFDRATYDVTLRWPKGRGLLASGRIVESGEEGVRRWERRKLEVPAKAFSFEVGDFEIRKIRTGHVDLTIGFSKAEGEVHKDTKDDIVQTLQEALAFFEERFGPYPLDYMTVVTVPRERSEASLGFISLSHYLLWRPSGWGWAVSKIDERGDFEAVRRERRETVAHELAHQWWGNKVGWLSYRDLWLSEALADFSATMFGAQKAENRSLYLVRHARRWRESLSQNSRYGRVVESLGPVVMGTRLDSSQSSIAYQAVVYDKGSVVFHMLAKALGPQPFVEMLKALAEAVKNRVIDTPTFLAAIERMSGAELDDFADRFIYGTGLPEVYYTYRFVGQEGGGWLIEGEARQVSPGRYEYTLLKTEAGTWDVARHYRPDLDIDRSRLIVPFQVPLAEAKDKTIITSPRTGAKTTTQTGVVGILALQGEVTSIRIPIDRQPESFWLDQRGEVLANFYCEQREPKRMLSYRGWELARAGRHDEAEELYHKALQAPLLSQELIADLPAKRHGELLSRRQDAAVHIGLAEIHLDRGRDLEAAAALDAADRLLTRLEKNQYDFWRKTLRARIATRKGDYPSVYDELSKQLYLDFPYRMDETLADGARQQRFRTGDRGYGDGDDYALLAASAWETGHRDVALQALQEAEKRYADVEELKTLMASSAAKP